MEKKETVTAWQTLTVNYGILDRIRVLFGGKTRIELTHTFHKESEAVMNIVNTTTVEPIFPPFFQKKRTGLILCDTQNTDQCAQ